MQNQTSDNNKRIVKNTNIHYFRMFFIIMVLLFTFSAIWNCFKFLKWQL